MMHFDTKTHISPKIYNRYTLFLKGCKDKGLCALGYQYCIITNENVGYLCESTSQDARR